jgi:nitroreductase
MEEGIFYVREILFNYPEIVYLEKNLDLLDVITKRRSIRSFKKQELSQTIIEKLVEAARWAPSAGNFQPWVFVVASSQKIKQNLSIAAYSQKALEEASIVIVVCVDEKRAAESYGVRGKTLYCIQDTAAAIQNILLTAHSLGLGSCWIGAFKENEIKIVIEAPKEMRPIALIPIGYPNESPPVRNRRTLSEIMYKETF